MIDESFINKIVSLAREESIKIGDYDYILGEYNLIKPPTPSTLGCHSLGAVIDYVENNPDSIDIEKTIIHVLSPTQVYILSCLDQKFKTRDNYLQASHEVDRFEFSRHMDQKRFITELQAKFVMEKQLIDVISVVGNISNDTSITEEDDGMTQKATAKSGVVRLSEVKIPNPVKLKCKQTFPEVDQPECEYVLRIEKGHSGITFALYEADNSNWKRIAIDNIASFLKDNIKKSIQILS